MLFAGRKARPGSRRISRTQTSGAGGYEPLHLHEGSFRQDSLSLRSGIYPHCSARVSAGIALPLLVLSFALSHRKTIEKLRPRLPSSSTSLMPKPIPSADNDLGTSEFSPPAKSVALPATVVPRNFRRLTPSLFAGMSLGFMARFSRLPSASASTNSARCLTRDGEL